MQKKRTHVVKKATVAVVVASAILMQPIAAWAGDTLPYTGDAARGENQPFQHGYRAEDIMNWDLSTDPYAQLLRARVPLQDRNAAFAATQANPGLSSEPEYLTLTGDYGNSFFDSYPYTNEFSQHVFNFWQYVDQYASWHGMPSVDVSETLYDSAGERAGTSDWQKRNFEFGLVNFPNPGYTNAAHKNGVLSLGCIFQPRAYQNFEVMLYTDDSGRYPVADKLVEICEYFGFDGWFFNMEGRSYSAEVSQKLKDFFAQMREDGLYIQWYSASATFNDATAGYLTSATAQSAAGAVDRANSVFLDYGWSYSLASSVAKAESYGLDALKSVFGGIEAGRDRWSNNYDRFLSNGDMLASIASLGTDFVQTGLDEDLGNWKQFRRETDSYQWMAFERERLWWSGGNSDPTTPAAISNADVAASGSMKGVAGYIAERSVINGDTFVTNFNTGHGLEYVKDGAVSNTHEWSNIGIQDILPTWQWWMDSTGTKLNVDFDYGTKYEKTLKSGTSGSFDFDLVGAYNGGSSLVVYGDMDAENTLRLYKTDLSVNAQSKMDVTFLKSSSDATTMKLGVIFKDAPDTVVPFEIADTDAQSAGWVTSTVDLSASAGKTIAALGLVFDGASTGYQMNIGEMRYTSGADIKPAAPTGMKIDKAYDTGEMVVSWNMANYNTVKQYNIYANDQYMGGVYDETFYIKDVYDVSGEVTIKVTAVSADGTESNPAEAVFDFDNAVSGVVVDNSTDGVLDVSWDTGAADIMVTTLYEEAPRSWTGSGNGSASITIPTGAEADGAYYSMKITKQGGETIFYEGNLPDEYCAPYDGKIDANLTFTQPLNTQWYKLRYSVVTNGTRGTEDVYTRGVKSHGELNNDWSMFKALSSSASGAYVTMEDYEGNVSAEIYVPLNDDIAITINSAGNSLNPGDTMQFTASVVNADDETVTWSVEGNLALGTIIDESGLLTVDAEETASAITVKATSVEDSSYFATKKITILGQGGGLISENATILGASNDGNAGEKKEMAIDGDFDTKWCASPNTGWLALDLGQEYVITRWLTVHGEQGDGEPGFNTEKFALEILKDPEATAEELQSSTYLANKDNWQEVEFIDNATEQAMIVDSTLATPATARYIRLRIDDATINQWTAIRIHEIEIYGNIPAPEPTEQAAAPYASPSGSSLVSGATVSLYCDTADAAIYYTLDGFDPTDGSTLYTGPITVTQAVTIKAIAYKDGLLPSNVMAESYTIKTDPVGPVDPGTTGSSGSTYTPPVTVKGDSGVKLQLNASQLPSGVKAEDVTMSVQTQDGASKPVQAVNAVLTANANFPAVNGMTVYDLNLLLKNGKTVSFTGKVKVSVPLAGMGNHLRVFHVDDNGGMTEVHAVINGDAIEFEVEHFSYYAVVDFASYAGTFPLTLKAGTTGTEAETTPAVTTAPQAETDGTTASTGGNAEKNPTTGAVAIPAGMLLVAFAGAFATYRKKR